MGRGQRQIPGAGAAVCSAPLHAPPPAPSAPPSSPQSGHTFLDSPVPGPGRGGQTPRLVPLPTRRAPARGAPVLTPRGPSCSQAEQATVRRAERAARPLPCFQTTPGAAPAPPLLPSVCPRPPPPSVEAAATLKCGWQHPLLAFPRGPGRIKPLESEIGKIPASAPRHLLAPPPLPPMQKPEN